MESSQVVGGEGGSYPSDNVAIVQYSAQEQGCTLDRYAKRKQLPVEFLKSECRLTEITYQGHPAVRIPHFGIDGTTEIGVLFRMALDKSQDGPDTRFKRKAETHAVLYGLERLGQARDMGYVTLVEGPSDCHTLWYNGEPAVGAPGASGWQEEWAVYFDGIPIIYIIIEPDAGGEATLKWLAKSSLRERARLIHLEALAA